MTNTTKEDELRQAVLANLKHAYLNAKTDTVALNNGVIPNHNHALGILENKTDDIMQLIKQYGLEQRIDEVQKPLKEFSNNRIEGKGYDFYFALSNRNDELTALKEQEKE